MEEEKWKILLGDEGYALLQQIDAETTPEAIQQMDLNWITAINSKPYFKRKEYFHRTHDKRINLKMDEYHNYIVNDKDFMI